MGALVPISPWIPEDDLLLKNSVEAGASLESLAKGAVRFSRRFTLHELQERWYSLLYDPVISEQASTQMAELQKSTSSLSSKSNKFGVSKGNECVFGKRKEESVRSLYYAMRKRICTEPCSSMDLSFLVAPSHHKCAGNGVCQDQLTLLNENSDGNCIVGDPIAEDFELQDTDFDIVRHAFPQIANADNTEVNHGFHYGHMGSFEGDLPDGIMGRDCLYGFAENVPPFSVDEAVRNDLGNSFDQHNAHKDIPKTLGESMSAFDNNAGVQEIERPQEMPVSVYDSITNNQQNACSGFGENQDFNATALDCGPSFDQLGFSSPLPALPDITTQTTQTDEKGKDKNAGDALVLSSGDDDNIPAGSLLKERQNVDGLANSTAISEGDFADLSNMNFTHEDVLLFMEDDGKDMLDRSCLDGINSVLFSSQNDAHGNDIADLSDPKASTALGTGFAITDVARSLELDVVDDPVSSGQKACDSEISMPSCPTVINPDFPEYRNGVICCVLNTEDPEIPCNDDVFAPSQVLPSYVTSAMQHSSEGTSVPPSTKDLGDNQKATAQGLRIVNKGAQTPGTVSSRKESHVVPEICPKYSINDSGVKSEMVDSEPTRASICGGEKCGSLLASQNSIPAGEPKKECSQVELGKHSDFDNSLMERQIHASDHLNNQAQVNFDGNKQEADAHAAIQIHAEMKSVGMGFQEHGLSMSDQEQQLSENDDEIPYFSDIEAMILDMDLDPSNEDLHLSKEVSRYQYEDTKRAIIRLEQGSNSYMQRATASHNAFAVFYGRYLKYYIMKPEVLLGRETEDVIVDIDLGREGRANKISRRQAIIKMEEDGSFYMRNLSKCSITVNSTELPGGHRLKLSSSCLIEIRDMKFLFEVNENFVKQYLAKNMLKRQTSKS